MSAVPELHPGRPWFALVDRGRRRRPRYSLRRTTPDGERLHPADRQYETDDFVRGALIGSWAARALGYEFFVPEADD